MSTSLSSDETKRENKTMKSKFLAVAHYTHSSLQETRSTLLFMTVYYVTIKLSRGQLWNWKDARQLRSEVKTLPLRYYLADRAVLVVMGEERISLPTKMEKNLIFFGFMKNKTYYKFSVSSFAFNLKSKASLLCLKEGPLSY